MKVAFIARSSLDSVQGGDSVQVHKTAQELGKLGVKADIFKACETIPYQKYDLLHFFNIIRPADHLYHIEKSKKNFVISTIYLDYTSFDRNGRQPIQRYLFSALGKSGSEYVKNIYRFINAQDKIVSHEYLIGHRRAMRKVLKKAALLLPNSESEYKRLFHDLKISKPFQVIPNGIDPGLFGQLPGRVDRQEKVICVAQIYGMKNQHSLIKVCNELGYPLQIIGKSPPNHRNYYLQCRRMAGSLVNFTDHLPQKDLISIYASAKVHALPSWFETTGLSSLEAAAMGCNLVVGTGGDTREYFRDMAWYCQADKEDSIKQALKHAMIRDNNPDLQELVLQNYTWEIAAQKTRDAYLKVLNEES